MSRRLQWQYLLPRLALLVVIYLAAEYGLAIAVRTAVTARAVTVLGSRVELADARAHLLDGQVVLGDLRVNDPRQPQHAPLAADRCELDIEPGALWAKRIVVRQGRLEGLRFQPPTERVAAVASPRVTWSHDHTAEHARQWLLSLDAQFERDLLHELRTVQMAEELLARWPGKHAALDERVRELTARIQELQAAVEAAQANPLRHVEFLATLTDAIAGLEAELDQLAATSGELPEVVDADRRAIAAARRHDDQFIRDQLHTEPIDPRALSAYLLQRQVEAPVAELIAWLRHTRGLSPCCEPEPSSTFAPLTQKGDCPPRTPRAQSPLTPRRGETIHFPGCPPLPDLLIRSLDLRGSGRIGGQPFALHGTLTDASSQPSRHDQPIRLRLKATGSLTLDLQATIDRTGPVPKDTLLVDCRDLLLPAQSLGQSDQLRLSIEPTVASLSLSITLEGDRLAGDIQLVERDVRLTPSASDNLGRVQLTAAVSESLRDLRSVAVRVSLGGTLDEPTAMLWSNLGPAVAEALDRALPRATDFRTRELLARSQQQIDAQFAAVEQQVAEQQSALAPLLDDSARWLTTTAQTYQPPRRLEAERLGRRLPANSLFR